MKTFEQFLNEMAFNSGNLDRNFNNKEHEWNEYYKDKEISKLVFDRIGAEHYKVYQVMSKYFLTTEDNDYLGNVELQKRSNKYYINSSHTKLKSGFYFIMFTVLLSGNEINEILSDTSLSNAAGKSYEKLSTNQLLNVRLYNSVTDEYSPFSFKELFRDDNIRVSVKEAEKFNIREHFEDYYYRLDKIDKVGELTFKSSWRIAYDARSLDANSLLFGNNLEEVD